MVPSQARHWCWLLHAGGPLRAGPGQGWSLSTGWLPPLPETWPWSPSVFPGLRPGCRHPWLQQPPLTPDSPVPALSAKGAPRLGPHALGLQACCRPGTLASLGPLPSAKEGRKEGGRNECWVCAMSQGLRPTPRAGGRSVTSTHCRHWETSWPSNSLHSNQASLGQAKVKRVGADPGSPLRLA